MSSTFDSPKPREDPIIGCGRGKGILVLVTLFWIVFIKELPGTDFLGDISQNIMHTF
jgi:hypothetical protein